MKKNKDELAVQPLIIDGHTDDDLLTRYVVF